VSASRDRLDFIQVLIPPEMGLIEVRPDTGLYTAVTESTAIVLQVIANDRLGRKGEINTLLHCSRAGPNFSSVTVKCSPDDTVGDLKKLIAAQTGTDASKIQLKKW
jgi:hypothetical protein